MQLKKSENFHTVFSLEKFEIGCVVFRIMYLWPWSGPQLFIVSVQIHAPRPVDKWKCCHYFNITCFASPNQNFDFLTAVLSPSNRTKTEINFTHPKMPVPFKSGQKYLQLFGKIVFNPNNVIEMKNIWPCGRDFGESKPQDQLCSALLDSCSFFFF